MERALDLLCIEKGDFLYSVSDPDTKLVAISGVCKYGDTHIVTCGLATGKGKGRNKDYKMIEAKSLRLWDY